MLRWGRIVSGLVWLVPIEIEFSYAVWHKGGCSVHFKCR